MGNETDLSALARLSREGIWNVSNDGRQSQQGAGLSGYVHHNVYATILHCECDIARMNDEESDGRIALPEQCPTFAAIEVDGVVGNRKEDPAVRIKEVHKMSVKQLEKEMNAVG